MLGSVNTSIPPMHAAQGTDLWLPPERGWRERYINVHLFAVATFALLTLITIVMMDQAQDDLLKALGTFLNFIITFIFGLSVEFWRQHARSSDANREQALRISKRLDSDMQQLSAEIIQAASPLMFFESKNDPGFKHSSGHLLIHMLDSLKNRIERAGLEIGELGFDQGAFIAEKGEKLKEIKAQSLKSLEDILPGFAYPRPGTYVAILPSSIQGANGLAATTQP